jgi:pimeloyl-ACP methyl ester carboxylesterase
MKNNRRTMLAVVAILMLATATPVGGAEADLPPLLKFTDGREVQAPADWRLRREEIRRLMGQVFVGSFPAETPRITTAEITREQVSPEGGSMKRRVRLIFDTANRASLEMTLWIPNGSGPFPILLVAPRYYQIPWAEEALRRGYLVCLFPGVDHMHHESAYPGYENAWKRFQAAYPEVAWTEIAAKGWLASRCLDYLLDTTHGYAFAPGQVAMIGHSRYGKQAVIAAAFDERITAVVARSSGSPSSCPYRFASHTTFMEPPNGFPGQWFLPSLRGFTGRVHELPFDAHGWLGLIAPRRLLLDTAYNDGCDPTFGVERAYRQGREVYRLLGHPENLRIDYRYGGHNNNMENPEEAIISLRRVRRNLDWLDLSFGRGTARPEHFPERLIHEFDWSDWCSRLAEEELKSPLPGAESSDDQAERRARIVWALGQSPEQLDWDERYTFLTPAESRVMSHDRWALPGIRRVPVSFGENVRGNLYFDPTAETPLPSVIWLHPYSYSSGYNGGYNVQDTTVYHRLAKEGFAVLAFDQCGFGLRLLEGCDFYDRCPNWSRLGRMVHDVHRAVDFLVDGRGASQDELPQLCTDHVYVVGYSLGGAVGLYAAALDARITGVASFAGFTPLRTDTDQRTTGGIRRLWEWHALQPKLGLFHGRQDEIPYDFDDVLALIAPRPCLVVSPQRDRFATHSDVVACVDRSRRFWKTRGAAERLTHLTPDDISRFQKAQHQQLRDWLAKQDPSAR